MAADWNTTGSTDAAITAGDFSGTWHEPKRIIAITPQPMPAATEPSTMTAAGGRGVALWCGPVVVFLSRFTARPRGSKPSMAEHGALAQPERAYLRALDWYRAEPVATELSWDPVAA